MNSTHDWLDPTPHQLRDEVGDYVPWYLDFEQTVMMEMPIEQLAPRLPPGLVPRTVRPGVGLLNLGVVRFDSGNVGRLPAFWEIFTSVVVQPDLSGGRVPTFAEFVLSVAGTDADFLTWAAAVDRMPVVDAPGLEVDYDPETLSLRVFDDRGPIVDLRMAHPDPHFEPRIFEDQAFTQTGTTLWQMVVRWVGEAFEHQHQSGPPAAVFHPHPMFEGLDVSAMGPCYQQLATPASTTGMLQFYTPRSIGTRAP